MKKNLGTNKVVPNKQVCFENIFRFSLSFKTLLLLFSCLVSCNVFHTVSKHAVFIVNFDESRVTSNNSHIVHCEYYVVLHCFIPPSHHFTPMFSPQPMFTRLSTKLQLLSDPKINAVCYNFFYLRFSHFSFTS